MQNFKTIAVVFLVEKVGPQKKKKERKKREKMPTISASAYGGPRSRVCACETLRLAPHRH